MQGNQVGFESSLQQHLDTEQRRAVLEAIGGSINPDSTLGEIIDAAEALGWSEKMGDLSLADLAEALLAPPGESATAVGQAAGHADEADAEAAADEDEDDADEDDADDDDADEDEDEDDADDEDEGFALELEEPAPSRRKPGKAAAAKESKSAAATKKKIAAASKKIASKKAAEPEPMRGSKKASKKVPAGKPGKKAEAPAPAPARTSRGAERAAPTPSKKTSKKAGRRKPTAVDVDDRMSLDEAAEFFLPVVEELGEATMQALEEQTGVSRRKLRFHVGQLVKHGYLERHGMGRGTYYTRR